MTLKTLPPKKISLIVYDKKGSPSYWEISRIGLKFLFYGMPFITILCVIALVFVAVYFKQIKTMVERKEPQEISRLKNLNLTLSKQNELLQLNEKELLTRLEQTEVTNFDDLGSSLFKITQGAKNLTQHPTQQINGERAEFTDTGIKLNFNIANLFPETSKISGYVFVLMKINNTLFFYPENASTTQEFKLKYNLGESFAANRLRNVEAIFEIPLQNSLQNSWIKKIENALFKILIFSRTGDLTHEKILTLKINPKKMLPIPTQVPTLTPTPTPIITNTLPQEEPTQEEPSQEEPSQNPNNPRGE